MTNEQRMKNLSVPSGKIDVVLDTDAYNEIDDQFAIAYLLSSKEKLNTKAIYAAPFFNRMSSGVADGMEKSYDEIFKLLDLMNEKCDVFKGSDKFLENESTPVISPAALDLTKRAMEYSPENPLYVVAIGAITNVASALLINPDIAERIVIVWLGGHSFEWPDTKEFNMYQDVAAARVVFDSKAPVVMLPCNGVVSAFTVSGDDMRARLWGKNDLCTDLTEYSEKEVSTYVKEGAAWSRVIWDVTAVAWITGALENGNQFIDYKIVPAPICEYDFTYSFDSSRKSIVYAYKIKRDALFNDMIKKLTK